MKEEQEVLSMYFEKNGQQIDLNLLWDNIKLSIPFTVDLAVKKG
jgi:hypothetical protein